MKLNFTLIKETVIKRIKEKSTWVGIITTVGSVFSLSLTGMPIEIIATAIASTIGGALTVANTTK